MVKLKKLSIGKNNNFNIIRFIAASLVLYSHSFALVTGSANSEPLKNSLGITWGYIAVDIFFITSGFLITVSYLSKRSIFHFIIARILRIFPALIMAIIFCVFVIGIYFTTLEKSEYLTNIQTYKFLIKNSILLFGIEYTLPGVFYENPWKKAVNGSLWTLPHEIKMYAVLLITLLTATILNQNSFKFSTKNLITFITATSITLLILSMKYSILDYNTIRLFTMFFIGTSFYFHRKKIIISNKIFIVCIILLCISITNKTAFNILYIFIIPYIVFYLAYIPKGKIRYFNNLGDYSYGIYIYAFPIQQAIASTFLNISIFNMITISFILILFFSIWSWQ